MKKSLDFKKFQKYLLKNKSIQTKMFDIVNERVEKNKQKTIEEFLSHPVSLEISKGPSGSNSSGTLGGYGNLFSFIGFSGGNPVVSWANFLKKQIFIKNNPTKKIKSNGFVFGFKINSISDADLTSIAPMPWEPGRSWIQAIERGISGFSFYVSLAGKGRSGGGLQSEYKKKAGMSSYRPVKYWSKIWNNFNKNISN